MNSIKSLTVLLIGLLIFSNTIAQNTICLDRTIQHEIASETLQETRNHWVSLPLNYSDTLKYPVNYVLDAEWRYGLVRHIAFDLGGHNKMQKSIIVGIPHIEWEHKRGIDLTFSQSRIEYDGETVDSTWYNASNSGGAGKFYDYLVHELIPDVDQQYSTSGHETLIGHSYGGYFGGYLLSLEHPFEVIHMYDPSLWYGNGEVTTRFKTEANKQQPAKVYVTYQPEPAFHKKKIEAFIQAIEESDHIELTKRFYPEETHNSLFLDSFYQGIQLTNK
jgi:predicted alpha/beta superfamily hydrolase